MNNVFLGKPPQSVIDFITKRYKTENGIWRFFQKTFHYDKSSKSWRNGNDIIEFDFSQSKWIISVDGFICSAIQTSSAAKKLNIKLTDAVTGKVSRKAAFWYKAEEDIPEKTYGSIVYHENYDLRNNVSKTFTLNEDFSLKTIEDLKQETSGQKFNVPGHTFINWTDIDRNAYSDGQTVRFDDDVIDLSANWQINQYTVTYSASPASDGTISVIANGHAIESGSKVNYKTALTINAVPNEGKALATLTVNGMPFENGGTYEVGDFDVSIEATFKQKYGTLTFCPCY